MCCLRPRCAFETIFVGLLVKDAAATSSVVLFLLIPRRDFLSGTDLVLPQPDRLRGVLTDPARHTNESGAPRTRSELL